MPPAPPPGRSQATRYLCAGAHLDDGFRKRVIEELLENRHRAVAPSFGIDAVPVLQHCLLARQIIAWRSLLLLVLVAVWCKVSMDGVVLVLAFVCDVWMTRWLWGVIRRRRGTLSPTAWGLLHVALYWFVLWALSLAVFYVYCLLAAVQGYSGPVPGNWTSPGENLGVRFGGPSMPLLSGSIRVWPFLVLPLILVGVNTAAQWYRHHVLVSRLGRGTFRGADPDWPKADTNPELSRIVTRIREQQHNQGYAYSEFVPFVGAGRFYGDLSWSFSIEMVPDPLQGEDGPAEPLTNAQVRDNIRAFVEHLASGETSPADRLHHVTVTDHVFVPGYGDGRVPVESVGSAAYTEQLAGWALGAADETIRHFLGIRVGAWEEELVVTLFVRTSTQGRVLFLEFTAFVLLPIDKAFHEVDELLPMENLAGALQMTWRGLRGLPHALLTAPLELWRVVSSWVRTGQNARKVRERDRHGLPVDRGPHASVRELGSGDAYRLLFQYLDAERYVKTVQARVTHAVKVCLARAGLLTQEFDQRVNMVINNGVTINNGTFTGSTIVAGQGSVRQGGAPGTGTGKGTG